MSTARRLTGADKRQIEAAIANAKRQDKRHKSAQDSIPFQRMFPDGICRVTDTYYTKTIQFQDINYQLSQNEDKTAIFDGWCDFLNYFDASVHFQLTFLNMAANKDTYGTQITIPLRGDEDDAIRTEYTQMLRDQLAKGNNGLIKTKYLTFGIEADGMKTAKPRLERIETDVLNNFKRLGVAAEPLNGTERLRLLHDMLNQASGDRQILAKQLNISPHQLSYVTHSGEGEGLLFYGNIILPFVDRFPKDTELYRVMTTKPNEVSGA